MSEGNTAKRGADEVIDDPTVGVYGAGRHGGSKGDEFAFKGLHLVRPHRALHKKTPLFAFNARLKARPAEPHNPVHLRVRQYRIDKTGTVTLRYLRKLRHIAVGRAYKHPRVHLLVADADVRIGDDDGVVLRHLTLDSHRDYQPLHTRTLVHDVLRQVSSMS